MDRIAGGGNDRTHQFCIGIYTPAANNSVGNGSIIDACGTVFNGTTQWEAISLVELELVLEIWIII
jgi:hypothetical protein